MLELQDGDSSPAGVPASRRKDSPLFPRSFTRSSLSPVVEELLAEQLVPDSRDPSSLALVWPHALRRTRRLRATVEAEMRPVGNYAPVA